jgi:hypothetical protein
VRANTPKFGRLAHALTTLACGALVGALAAALYAALVAGLHLALHGRLGRVPLFAAVCLLAGVLLGLAVSSAWALSARPQRVGQLRTPLPRRSALRSSVRPR